MACSGGRLTCRSNHHLVVCHLHVPRHLLTIWRYSYCDGLTKTWRADGPERKWPVGVAAGQLELTGRRGRRRAWQIGRFELTCSLAFWLDCDGCSSDAVFLHDSLIFASVLFIVLFMLYFVTCAFFELLFRVRCHICPQIYIAAFNIASGRGDYWMWFRSHLKKNTSGAAGGPLRLVGSHRVMLKDANNCH